MLEMVEGFGFGCCVLQLGFGAMHRLGWWLELTKNLIPAMTIKMHKLETEAAIPTVCCGSITDD